MQHVVTRDLAMPVSLFNRGYMSTARAERLRTRAAVLAAVVVAAHTGVVLIGWAAGRSLFLVPSRSFIPMAPTTALAFLALSLALIARLVVPASSPLRNAGTVLSWVVATLALVNLALPSLLDQMLGGSTGQFGRVRLGVMSPVTAAAIDRKSGVEGKRVDLGGRRIIKK